MNRSIAETALAELAGQFEDWRRSRTTGQERIPPSLWDRAVALSTVLPCVRVARRPAPRVCKLDCVNAPPETKRRSEVSGALTMTMPLNPVEREFSPELDKAGGGLAEHIKTEQDLTALSRHLLKRTVESALQAELDEHWVMSGMQQRAETRQQPGMGIRARRSKGELGEVSIKPRTQSQQAVFNRN